MHKVRTAEEIENRMEQCYNAVKKLYKEEFEQQIKGWSNLIYNLSQGKNISILEATIEIIKSVKEEDDNAYSTMVILASSYALLK